MQRVVDRHEVALVLHHDIDVLVGERVFVEQLGGVAVPRDAGHGLGE